MTTRAYGLLGVLLTLLVAMCSQNVHAANPVTFCGLCNGFTVSKRGVDEVLIRCPRMKDPWLVITGCAKPNIQRTSSSVRITCT